MAASRTTRSKTRKRNSSLVQEDDEQPAKLQKSDLICQLCSDFLKEVAVAVCGHSFCHKCITHYLVTTPQCPVCKVPLKTQRAKHPPIHPNFALNDIMAKVNQQEDKEKVLEKSSPDVAEVINSTALMSSSDVDKVLAHLLSLKSNKAQQEKECDDKVLLEFLSKAKESKEKVIINEIHLLDEDITRQEASSASSAGAVVPAASESLPLSSSSSLPVDELMTSVIAAQSSRMHSHFTELLDDYTATKIPPFEDSSVAEDTLSAFASGLKRLTKYASFKELSALSYGDPDQAGSIVFSMEFDNTCDFFAVAGGTKVIKVYDYHSILRGVGFTNHFPVLEMSCNAKLSSVYYNDFHKSTLASSDYEGYVAVWDTSCGRKVVSHHEHSKRVWSVVYNPSDPNVFASGSDDYTVKLWSSNTPQSIQTLRSKANVCTLRFNPENHYHLAYGSADHILYYVDLRNPKEPLHQLGGHRKAVSYVQFCSPTELVSASTDSKLKLWNVNNGRCLRTYKGHKNDKYFVGLTVTPHYIACGSENNSMYVYTKQVPRPMLTYKFNVSRNILQPDLPGQQRGPTDAVTSVCWKSNSNVILSANGQGHIKVLEMC